MSARPVWTIALIGAMVVWLSIFVASGQASLPDPDRVNPVAPDAETLATPAKRAPFKLADLLVSGHRHDQAGLAAPDGSSTLAISGPMTGERLALARRLDINAARQDAVEQTLPRTFVLVNIPQARLWMVRDGKVEGSMRVIVGRPDQPTPEMTAEITHVILNPRWNVPQDIVRSTLAPTAARSRGRSLTDAGFEVLSSWQDDAVVVPAREIDWRAVAAGRTEAPVRQKPGADNVMGSAKFVITNDDGIYLHDTPDRRAFRNSRRTLSAGCIRVEDYRHLVNFLVPQPLSPGRDPDRPTYIRLGAPMPIYLTYITAAASDGRPVLFPDPYELDS
ncbi:L,D-transpeptidase family protein [Brevundimonas sp. R86498]|uniref:L,D-transpeptidase family protein n=1 Tax=Brevundimonas sp. R86498 TaxID=3093845 RepID=UPI0037C56DDA